jgi:hypothetical protein
MTAMRNALTDEEYAEQAEKGNPERGRWSQTEQLLAAVHDQLAQIQHVLIAVNTDSKAKRPRAPEPMRRPGARGAKPKQKINNEQAAQLWSMLNGGAQAH